MVNKEGWECSKCTFWNKNNEKRCEACHVWKPAIPHKKKNIGGFEMLPEAIQNEATEGCLSPKEMIGKMIVYKLIDSGDVAWVCGTVKAKVDANHHSYRIVLLDARCVNVNLTQSTQGIVWDFLKTSQSITKEELQTLAQNTGKKM